MRLERHVGNGAQHHHHAHRGQAVEAIDDVHRVGDSGHREHRRHRGADGERDDPIEAGNVGASDHRAKRPSRKRRRDRSEEQAPTRALRLCEVLSQAGQESRDGADHQREADERLIAVQDPQPDQPSCETDDDAQPTDSRNRQCVKFLRPGHVHIARQMVVRVGEADQEEGDRQGQGETEQQNEHRASVFACKPPPLECPSFIG